MSKKNKKNDSKINNKYVRRFIIGFSLMLFAALMLIFYLSLPLLFGKTVVLETMPIDPFDIFRGQYLTIDYNISLIENTTEISSLIPGDIVYVVLKQIDEEKNIWAYDYATVKKPKNQVYIKGKIDHSWINFRRMTTDNRTVRVTYGIEQFYFERNAQFSTANITVEVKIWNGQARIKKLLKDGMDLKIEYIKYD